MEYLRVRNFEKFQHYSKRRPPWVKLYRDIWVAPEFHARSCEDKLYIIGMFTVASETGNLIPRDGTWLQRRLLLPHRPDFTSLIESGFIEACPHDASNLSATLTPRDRSTETETEVQKDIVRRFDVFWESYPRHEAKKNAFRAFVKLNPDDELLLSVMIPWIERAKESEQWQNMSLIPHAATWLNQERWTGDPPPPAPGKTSATAALKKSESTKPKTVVEWETDKDGRKLRAIVKTTEKAS